MGEILLGNQNMVGFCIYKFVFDLGLVVEKYIVKMSGCYFCLICCMI